MKAALPSLHGHPTRQNSPPPLTHISAFSADVNSFACACLVVCAAQATGGETGYYCAGAGSVWVCGENFLNPQRYPRVRVATKFQGGSR